MADQHTPASDHEEALNRLQKIASQVPGVVYQFRLRPDGSTCVPYASEAAREIYRLDPEEIREDASKVFAYAHPDDLENFKASIQISARHLTPWQHEYRLKFDDGTVRWLFGNAIPQREADGSTLWHGFITDVTERKRAEAEVLEVQSQLKATLDAIPDLLFEIGLDGRYYDCHFSRPELLALPAEVLIGKTVHDVLPPEATKVIMLALREAYEKGSSNGRQIELNLPQGRMWFELSVARKSGIAGQEPRFIVLSRDITGRKDIEERLRQNEGKLRAYLNNISDTIWLIDANLNMAYVSASVMRLLGVSPEELIGRPSALVIHPDDMVVVNDAQRYVMEHPGEPHTIQYRVSHKDGSWIDVESTGVNMLGNPAINGVLVTMRDVTERKRVEADLQASEASMRAILDNSPYLVWLKDTEGHYITANRTHANYAHLKDQREIIGKTDFDLWPKELAEKYRADDAEVIASRRQKHVEEPSFDGKKMHWVETFKTPIIDKNGHVLGTTGFARDITERKQAEQALIESESRFREIFNTVNDAIFIHDAETGRILDVNRRMLEMYGITREEALACGPDDLSVGTPPYSTAEAIEKIHLAHTEGPQTFDWLARARDGHLFWVEVSLRFALIGSHRRILAVVRDISERKRAEEELGIAAIAFESDDGMLVADANNVILRVNRAFTEITGYTAQEAIGQTPRLLSSGHHDADFYAEMWKDLQRAGAWKGEIWNRHKNGEAYPAQFTITAVKGNAGEITHYVATLHDITERKKAEEEINNLAFYDTLTQLPNRRMLDDRLGQAIAASKRSGCYGALMFLDLDNFKPLNDTYGHGVGDLLLIEVSHRLTGCVREVDTVARFGGDEFVVMLGDLDEDKAESTMQAGIVAEKIRAALAEPYLLTFRHESETETTVEHHCAASIGVMIFNSETGAGNIIKWADIAMYQAKEGGRNLVHFFEPESGNLPLS
ncbi:MAG: PAS domain S-box protein [Gallionella sp.]